MFIVSINLKENTILLISKFIINNIDIYQYLILIIHLFEFV